MITMDFEQALRAELVTITNLQNKVFPLNAPEGTSTPFLIYQKVNMAIIKTMDGTSYARNALYEIDLIAKSYSELQSLMVSVKNKLISFQGRTIGTNGSYIQNVTIENIVELYEPQPLFYRINMETRFYFEGE